MASSIEFAELLGRTNHSFLEAASHPEEMVEAAQKKGLAALGIADRDGLYGIVKSHVAARAAGLPLIVGARMTVEGLGAPLALLARNASGYAALSRLITTGRMRNPKGLCTVTLDEAASCAGGCLAVATSFLQWRRRSPAAAPGKPLPAPPRRPVLDLRTSVGELGRLREVFGAGLSVAVARHLAAGDDARLAAAEKASAGAQVPLLATNDPYFHVRERRPLHDVVTAIRERTPVAELGTRRLPNAEWHVKSGEEMARLFPDHPGALARSVELAGECSFTLDSIQYQYPDEWLPAGYQPMGWLRHLVEEGARWRYPEGTPEDVRRQLDHELALIEELDYPAYFLTVWDIVRYAREKSILCQGRGSAANSAVCYVLGVTSIDPVRMKLLFERFISAERGEPPDIDVDFEHERREEVIQHLYEKYGRDRAAMVANLITFRPRLAVREVGKAFGLSETQIGRLAGLAGERDLDWSGAARGSRRTSDIHDHAFEERPDAEEGMRLPDAEGPHSWRTTPEAVFAKGGVDVSEEVTRQVLALSRELLGFPRHLGIHSGGFALTRGPIHELCPTENATMPGRTVVEWDKEDLAAVGIMKVDVLALGMLTMIRKGLDLIRHHEGRDLSLATIPAEDPTVYDMCCAADTVGVFQIESRAQMNTLPRLLPRNFYDLVIEIALIRPGPIEGGMVQPLLRRRAGKEPVTYAHPLLKPILERTYGVPVFQEQAIKLAVAVAGFKPGEAEELRRSMTHKRSAERMAQLKGRLISGMAAKGIGPAAAEEIVHQLSGFAGYGFPESHSASFALLVYASAWIKCHHPAIFCAALLNSQPMGFYSPHSIVADAQRHGVEVRPVDVTRSRWDCTVEPEDDRRAVRVGYRYVRGLAGSLQERLDGGPFASMEEMVAARVPRDALVRMAAADAFRSTGLSRREALWAALRAMPEEGEVFTDGGHGEKRSPAFPGLGSKDRLFADYEAVGFSVEAHPMSLLRERFTKEGVLDSVAVSSSRNGARVTVGGMAIVRQRPPTAGDVVFITLEDERGFINLVVPPEIYDRYRAIARGALFMRVVGKVQRSGKAVGVQVERFEGIAEGELDVPERPIVHQASTPLPVRSRDFH